MPEIQAHNTKCKKDQRVEIYIHFHITKYLTGIDLANHELYS